MLTFLLIACPVAFLAAVIFLARLPDEAADMAAIRQIRSRQQARQQEGSL